MPLVNRKEDDESWKNAIMQGFFGKNEVEKNNLQPEILEKIIELNKKMDHQNKMISKLVSMISKMYQDGEIDKNTFNKLDEFLKSYYDNPYNDNY